MAGLRPRHALALVLLALGTPPALSAAAAYAQSLGRGKANAPRTQAAVRAQPAAVGRLSRHAGATGLELRIPLMLNRSRSALTGPELESTLAEINRIWRQAGICFEVRDIRHGHGPRSQLVLWFIEADEPFINGYFEDNQNIWAQDEPRLARAPTPAKWKGARTAAHELGHALGLRHVARTGAGLDALMNTGYDGYRLDADEVARARRAASRYALPMGAGGCRPPLL